MTDIYGYAAAAPLYRAAGWMQVIPCPRDARPHHPAVSLDAAANPSPTSRCGSGRSRIRLRTRASSSPKAYWFWTSTPNKGTRSRRTGRKASANSLRNWACFRPRGAARRTASTVRHATCSTRCPKGSRGRAAPSRASTSCSPATGIPSYGQASTLRRNVLLVHTQRLDHQPDPHISDLATLPWKWVDYLRKPEHTTPRPTSNTLISPETGTYDARMCKAINTFLHKTLSNPASKGSRHDTTLQAVWALVNFAQEGHRGALDAISQLKPRFIQEVAPTVRARNARPHANGPAFSAARWRRSTAYKRTRTHAGSRR